jgi:hypothetical protein
MPCCRERHITSQNSLTKIMGVLFLWVHRRYYRRYSEAQWLSLNSRVNGLGGDPFTRTSDRTGASHSLQAALLTLTDMRKIMAQNNLKLFHQLLGFSCSQKRDMRFWVLFRKGKKISLRNCLQTGSGAHLTSYLVGAEGSWPGSNSLDAWSWPLTFI